jgi:hypothetical protein
VVHGWLESWVVSVGFRHPASPPTLAKMVVNCAALLALAAFAAIWMRVVIRRQPAAERPCFPKLRCLFLLLIICRAASSTTTTGEDLIWRAYPEYRVYIDGRADVYRDPFMDSFADSYSLHGQWQAPLRAWQIRTAILPRTAPLLTGLQSTPGWKQVYEDSQAVIMVRDLHLMNSQ